LYRSNARSPCPSSVCAIITPEKGYAPLSDYYLTPSQTQVQPADPVPASDADAAEIAVNVRLSERTVGQGNTRKIHVAGISAKGAAKIEVSADGKEWTESRAFTSPDAITSFYIRITDGNGKLAYWRYKDGKAVRRQG